MGEEKSDSKIKDLFKDKKEPHKSQFIAAVLVNLIFLYIANNLLNWNLSFIDNSFLQVLGILNIFFIVAVVVNFLFIFYSKDWFRNLFQIPVDLLGLVTAYSLFTIFPFIINNILLEYILKFILLVFIIGSFISLVVHFIKFILNILDR
ncbi:MAG: hypothetical protein LLF83_04670 [Methanobacterium sp.]|nr:hypothetical protein [Methanobacterium sp.]